MTQYRVIFFDLDHTLWDYDKNSVEALSDLYNKYGLQDSQTITLELFLKTFTKVNDRLWNNYNKGHIDRSVIRTQRFYSILKEFGLDDRQMSLDMSEEYIETCPQKTNLFPHTNEVLTYLKKRYELYILTNGFDDVQQVKMSRSKLTSYFKGMITSDSSGHRKPSKEIFEYALLQAKAENHETVMVGDNLSADIGGAQNVSIDTIYFNPHKYEHKATINHEIDCLSQLLKIL